MAVYRVGGVFESYAQNSEDVVLWRALKSIDEGTYVDVGAADPDEDSVTKAFYERGWSGLNVEPAPDYAERLAAARPRDRLAQVCAGATTGSIVLQHVAGTGLSSVVEGAVKLRDDESFTIEEIEVPLRRLDDLLDEAGFTPSDDIHFLKIDVEGFEESVIRGIDLTAWRPWIIVAESTRPRSTDQAHHKWEALLVDQGYELCLFDGLNRFYVALEHAELRDLLSFPAGVFDQPYLAPAHAKLLFEYDNLISGHRRLEDMYDSALESHDQLISEFDRSTTAHGELEATHQHTANAHQRLETTYHETVDAYHRLETTYHETVGAYQRLETTYYETIDAYDRLSDLHATLGTERDELEAEVATLRDGVARMGAQFDHIRAERDNARLELELTRQTLSWRVTRPLRSIRRLSVD